MDAISRRLLFRIGPVGFSLGLDELIEIREQVGDQVDVTQVDPQLFVVGALPFRRTMIPVFDLAARLAIESSEPDTALVLSSSEGNWAMMVDKVEGFFPETDFIDRPLPRLLLADGWRCFNVLALLRETPYLKLELSACYAGQQN